MSVINQMLKDLEQRTPEQGHAPNAVMVSNKPSTVKTIAISLVVLLSLNVLGFYVWDLQTRLSTSELKVQENSAQPVPKQQTLSQQVPSQQIIRQSSAAPLASAKNNTKQSLSQQSTAKQAVAVKNNIKKIITKQFVPEPTTEVVVKVSENKASASEEQEFSPQKFSQQTSPQQLIRKPLKPTVKVNENVAPLAALPSVKASKMSVSRRQLSTKELVTQKLARAEKAINANQITKAETLFEDVLIIQPSNKQARKKLSALWFGRKSYQQAVNLLSQGIALDKHDSELRMLKAQIQLQQGQHKGAYHTLKALSDLKQQYYQVMLANVAQQVNAYESAIKAYQILIKMQPYSGKWHLGLAIVYDKNSQFTLAEKEYALALSKSDLSSASAEFAAQRMQALGE